MGYKKMCSEFDEVLTFWFEETTPQQYWTKDDAFDDTIRNRFSSLHERAAKGKLQHWRDSPLGALAEIVILDQFSRNIYRGDPGLLRTMSYVSSWQRRLLKKDLIGNWISRKENFFTCRLCTVKLKKIMRRQYSYF